MTNPDDVPIQFRMYVDEKEEEKYRKMGVTIYTGSHGGKFIDLRELGRVRREKRKKESKLDGKISKDEFVKLRDELSSVLLNIRNSEFNNNSKFIEKAAQYIDRLNSNRKGRFASYFSGELDDTFVENVEEMRTGTLNGEGMLRVTFKDGSRMYLKRAVNDDLEPSWLAINNIVNSYILRYLLGEDNEIAKLMPNYSFVKYNDTWYVGSEEMYGVVLGDVVGSAKIKKSKDLEDFIAGAITLGLWDMSGGNLMYIPSKGLVVPFDMDFSGNLRDEAFFGILDTIQFVGIDEPLDSEYIMKKIEEFVKRKDEIMNLISNVDKIEHFLGVWDDSGLDSYDLEELFYNIEGGLSRVLKYYKQWKEGKISAKEALNILGSDVSKDEEIMEILKSVKVPAEYRVYVTSWQAQRLRRKGIRVYKGPRGGLYVDARELRHKNVEELPQEKSKVEIPYNLDYADWDSLKEVMSKPEGSLALRNILGRAIDYVVEKYIDYKLGNDKNKYMNNYFMTLNSAYVLNKFNTYRQANDLDYDEFKIINFDSAGAQPGVLNVADMIILEAKDGSRVYAKRISEDAPHPGNNLTVPALLKVLVGSEDYGFIPTPRLLKYKDSWYAGISGVYGLTITDLPFEERRVGNKERFKKFLAAHFVLGLDDSIHNSFRDLLNGTFIQFDYDFAYHRGGSMSVNAIIEDYMKNGVLSEDDAVDIRRMGVQMLVDNYDELKKVLKLMKLYAISSTGDDKCCDSDFKRAESWVDTIYNKGRNNIDDAVKYIVGDYVD